ncbi:DUF3290 family protein [Gemella cuniculi]|uniref:DUF3290 family protein n=1 Tax=Gemella cuniculi TaxID=150240 RepID=UPI0004821142|nr:DUF3290 family protein [Gemella cuniculi]
MKFYSYKYLLSKVEQSNMMEFILGGILVLFLIFSLFKYYRNKQDSKYRELAIIFIFGIFLLVGIEVSSYQKSSISTDQYKSSVKFIENIANHLKIDKETIYINSEASIENSFVKIDDAYYRVISSGKKDDYLLEKIELVDPIVEKVEVFK